MCVPLLGLALAACPVADAANVSGRVTTPQGIGIPGIDIDVIDAAGIPVDILDDDTDTDGSYDFLVPDGRYRIRFQAPPSRSEPIGLYPSSKTGGPCFRRAQTTPSSRGSCGRFANDSPRVRDLRS